MRPRVIPVLLIKNGGVVKTVKFQNPVYIGDPLNAIRLFNDMQVDELMVLDILATRNHTPPALEFIKQLAEEAFMPMCYGGGINSIQIIGELLNLGIEKVAINYAALRSTSIIEEASLRFGSQSIVGVIDAKTSVFGGYRVYDHEAGNSLHLTPVSQAQRLEAAGTGEIFLNSVDNDGRMRGFDLRLIQDVSRAVTIPVVACGGAADLKDLAAAIKSGASAAAAGSMFVFQGKYRGVLINYPSQDELAKAFALL